MRVSIQVDLVPFKVPEYVGSRVPGSAPFSLEDEFKGGRKYLLSELSEEDLTALCTEFT